MDFLLGLLFDGLRTLAMTLFVRAYKKLRRPQPFGPPADGVAWLLAALICFLAASAIGLMLALT